MFYYINGGFKQAHKNLSLLSKYNNINIYFASDSWSVSHRKGARIT